MSDQSNSATLYKTPPHDDDAERSVLGAVLIDSGAIALVAEFLRAKYFYLRKHSLIYDGMLNLFEQQSPIDIVTLKNQLQKNGVLKECGGTKYLSELLNAVPTSAYIEQYGNIVKSLYTKRKLIDVASRSVERAFGDKGDIKELIDDFESSIFSLAQEHMHRDFIPLKDILTESFEKLEEFMKSGKKIKGIPTGFSTLDAKLSGMQDSNLIILAARPGVGKTSFALNIALHVAMKEKRPVGFFSLEMSKEELVDRLVVGQSDVDAWRLKTGRVSDEDTKRIVQAMGELSEAQIYIDDTPGMSILEMRTKARKLKAEKGLDLIVVDYLQLAHGGREYESRVQEVSSISQGLKNLARELQIPVLSLSQLNRSVEQRGVKKPQLADLRECVTGNTLIFDTSNGHLRSIEDLYMQNEVLNSANKHTAVLSMDENFQFVPSRVMNVVQSGIKQIYTVETTSGKQISVSLNHPFYTSSGWKKLENIRKGEYIAVAGLIPWENKKSMESDLARFLGYMIGDGSYLKHRCCGFTNADKSVAQDAIDIAHKYFGVDTHIDHHNNAINIDFISKYGQYGKPFGNKLLNYLRDINIHGDRTEVKKVPDVVMEGNSECIIEFLKGIFTADGTIVLRKSGRIEIKYASTSYLLIRQVRNLLLRLGISSDLRKGRKGKFSIYYLEIDDRDEMVKYLEIIGFVGIKQKKAKNCLKLLLSRGRNERNHLYPLEITDYVRTLKLNRGLSWRELGYRCQGKRISRYFLKKIATVLKDQYLNTLVSSHYVWERIKEIKKNSKEMTYDLEIEKTHNFVANEIVVHNSGAIEQDADVVMFIYSEDDEDDLLDASQRAVKLNIAKHRNGPTGEISLMFRGDRVRFYTVDTTSADL